MKIINKTMPEETELEAQLARGFFYGFVNFTRRKHYSVGQRPTVEKPFFLVGQNSAPSHGIVNVGEVQKVARFKTREKLPAQLFAPFTFDVGNSSVAPHDFRRAVKSLMRNVGKKILVNKLPVAVCQGIIPFKFLRASQSGGFADVQRPHLFSVMRLSIFLSVCAMPSLASSPMFFIVLSTPLTTMPSPSKNSLPLRLMA